MKLSALIISLFILPVFAQKHFLEYQIGATVSTVIAPDPLHRDALLTFAFGAAYRLNFKKVSFSIGLGWQPRGFANEVSFLDAQGQVLGDNAFRREKMNYLNTELIASKIFGNQHGLLIGMGFSTSRYLYSKAYIPYTPLDNGYYQPAIKEKISNVEPWDFGLITRLGYIHKKFSRYYVFVYLDYYHGLKEISYTSNSDYSAWKNRAYTVRFGHGFYLNREKNN